MAVETMALAMAIAAGGGATESAAATKAVADSRQNAPEDAAKAARAILKAIAEGDVTPLEAASVMAVVEQFRRTLETTEIERRIAALEAGK